MAGIGPSAMMSRPPSRPSIGKTRDYEKHLQEMIAAQKEWPFEAEANERPTRR